ncbi:hypothetical protein DFH07DRAFT_775325 [Mycena maculata]|uniref:Uncharacterized protein n=1 Tax=Mycena maculata TaxID=230809 RepID=A0AAD7IUR4_9AGAR|nr:hypothetical protein DFH07DRAFT_775325 [Mycena maculata]
MPPATAPPARIPARGDRNAPHFNSSKPHELRRYFTDLEFLFSEASITDETKMKKHTTRFLLIKDQETWETLLSFTDATKKYDAFKADVLKLYSGNEEDRRFGLSDLDALVGHYSRSRLSPTELSRAFLRAMQPAAFSLAVHHRLQIKKPDNHPEDPYALEDLFEAAQFCIAGPVSTIAFSPIVPATSSPAPTEIKSDPSIAALVGTVSELIKVLANGKASSANSNNGTGFKKRPDGCGYCSDLDHFINQCRHVLDDIKAGKVRRNSDSKVVLPNGSFVPRSIPGPNLRARVEEWHKQNPGQLAIAQLLVEVAMDHLAPPSNFATPAEARTFALSAEEHIQTLEHEINTIHTRSQAQRAFQAEREETDRTIPHPATTTPATVTPDSAPPVAPTAQTMPSNPPPAPAYAHPFSAARDGAYAPPKDRNFGIPAQKPAYRTNAPVYNKQDAADVFNASLDAPISMTQRQLLSIAPEVRAHMREATSSRWVPSKDNKPNNVPVSQMLNSIDEVLPYSPEPDTLEEQRSKDNRHTALLDSLPTAYTSAAESNLPPGAVVIPDPYAMYYENGSSIPDDLIVSMESSAIRSIIPIVDNRERVECIVNGGSQIIAMSEMVCHDLSLAYDPTIVLRMQSANGTGFPNDPKAHNSRT